jgi:hypothetical protein
MAASFQRLADHCCSANSTQVRRHESVDPGQPGPAFGGKLVTCSSLKLGIPRKVCRVSEMPRT